MFEDGTDGFFSIGHDWRYSYVSGEGARLADRPSDELQGELVWETFPGLEDSAFGDALQRTMNSRESTQVEAYYPPFESWYDMKAYPTENGLSVYFRDVTETKAREQQFEAIFNNTYTLLGLVEGDGTLTAVNERVFEFSCVDRETAIDTPIWELDPFQTHPEATSTIRDAVELARQGEQFQDEIQIGRADREIVIHITVRPVTNEDGEVIHLLFEGRDVTERKALTQELRRERDFIETAIDTLNDVFYVVGPDGGLRRWNSSLSKVTGYEEEAIEGMQAIDFFPDDETESISSAIDKTLETGETVVEADILTADGDRIPYQFTGVRLTDTEDELIGLVGIGRDITERNRRERELRQQREQLEALNSLNMIVRDITDAVIEQSTRDEIERIACEKLAGSDSYTIAWTAETASTSRNVRSAAGLAGDRVEPDEYQAELSEQLERRPVIKTFKTGDTCVSQNVLADPKFESWQALATEWGFRSFIAVPIVHKGAQFGVLGVHSNREDAFDHEEREIIEQLGEIAGYVFYAIERKETLGSALRLAFRSEQLAESFPSDTAEAVNLTLDAIVPLDEYEDRYIEYWKINEDYIEEFETFVEQHKSKVNAQLVEIREGRARFNVSARSGSISSTFAGQDGTLQAAHLSDDAIEMVGDFPEAVDPETITEEFRDRFPGIELVSQERVLTPEYLRQTVEEHLTDRQQTVLQIAHFGGYFAQPRRSTGEELATHLDITKQTFHHHLRNAESAVCNVLFEDPADPLI